MYECLPSVAMHFKWYSASTGDGPSTEWMDKWTIVDDGAIFNCFM